MEDQQIMSALSGLLEYGDDIPIFARLGDRLYVSDKRTVVSWPCSDPAIPVDKVLALPRKADLARACTLSPVGYLDAAGEILPVHQLTCPADEVLERVRRGVATVTGGKFVSAGTSAIELLDMMLVSDAATFRFAWTESGLAISEEDGAGEPTEVVLRGTAAKEITGMSARHARGKLTALGLLCTDPNGSLLVSAMPTWPGVLRVASDELDVFIGPAKGWPKEQPAAPAAPPVTAPPVVAPPTEAPAAVAPAEPVATPVAPPAAATAPKPVKLGIDDHLDNLARDINQMLTGQKAYLDNLREAVAGSKNMLKDVAAVRKLLAGLPQERKSDELAKLRTQIADLEKVLATGREHQQRVASFLASVMEKAHKA